MTLTDSKEAKAFLEKYRGQLLRSQGASIQIVYTMHPSHSANYSKDCHKKRNALFQAIEYAYGQLPGQPNSTRESILGPPLVSSTDKSSSQTRRVRTIQEFLDVLGILCFHEGNLPARCISPKAKPSYFAFTTDQKIILRHMMFCVDHQSSRKNRARAELVPLLLSLNRTLQKRGYFGDALTADLVRISVALSRAPSDLEELCELLMGVEDSTGHDVFSVEALFDQLPFPVLEDEHARRMAKLERIVLRAQTGGLFTKQARLRRNKPEILREFCGCDHGFRFSDSELQDGFREAYHVEHDCYSSNCRYESRVETVTVCNSTSTRSRIVI